MAGAASRMCKHSQKQRIQYSDPSHTPMHRSGQAGRERGREGSLSGRTEFSVGQACTPAYAASAKRVPTTSGPASEKKHKSTYAIADLVSKVAPRLSTACRVLPGARLFEYGAELCCMPVSKCRTQADRHFVLPATNFSDVHAPLHFRLSPLSPH